MLLCRISVKHIGDELNAAPVQERPDVQRIQTRVWQDRENLNVSTNETSYSTHYELQQVFGRRCNFGLKTDSQPGEPLIRWLNFQRCTACLREHRHNNNRLPGGLIVANCHNGETAGHLWLNAWQIYQWCCTRNALAAE